LGRSLAGPAAGVLPVVGVIYIVVTIFGNEVCSMSRLFAFLRAINVGGHTVKMDYLRQLFESLGFSSVETFIASGNVVFQATTEDVEILERMIESKLREALGYDVATFIRSEAELAAIADYKPFRQAALNGAAALNIAFLTGPPDEQSAQKLMALRTQTKEKGKFISIFTVI